VDIKVAGTTHRRTSRAPEGQQQLDRKKEKKHDPISARVEDPSQHRADTVHSDYLKKLHDVATTVLLLFAVSSAAAVAANGGAIASLELPFTLAPASRTAPAYRVSALTWGMSVIQGDDHKYHGFAAQMTKGCGLGAWQTSSEAVHTVSNWAVRVPRHDAPGLCAQPPGRARAGRNLRALQHRPAVDTGAGARLQPGRSKAGAGAVLRECHLRPPRRESRGAVDRAGRRRDAAGLHQPGAAHLSERERRRHAATAPSWKGPYTLNRERLVIGWDPAVDGPWVFEDPFPWFSAKRGVWSMMMHQYNRTDPAHQRIGGGYAASAGESIWSKWAWGNYRLSLYTGLRLRRRLD